MMRARLGVVLLLGAAVTGCGDSVTGPCFGLGGSCTGPPPCPESVFQSYLAVYSGLQSDVVDPDAPLLELRLRVGRQASLFFHPIGGGNVCSTAIDWVSTNPAAVSLRNGDPTAGNYASTYGGAVLFALAPGDSEVYASRNGVRYDLMVGPSYGGPGYKRIARIHVVP